jgi:hypothetical protein
VPLGFDGKPKTPNETRLSADPTRRETGPSARIYFYTRNNVSHPSRAHKKVESAQQAQMRWKVGSSADIRDSNF